MVQQLGCLAMGALTSNRKRSDEFFNLNTKHPHLNSSDFQSPKRLKFSSMNQTLDRPASSKTTVSRISRYPEDTPRIRREVHAPVRPSKFGLFRDFYREFRATTSIGGSGKEEYTTSEMGNVLTNRYERAKNRALRTIRYFTSSKEVIELEDDERQKEAVSEVSRLEEIDVASGSNKLKDVEVGAANLPESVLSELSNGNAVEVENAGNMLVSLSLDRDDGLEVLSKSAYQKLLEDARRRNAKIEEIDFDIKLYEEKWSSLQQMRPPRKTEDKPREPFVPLTAEEEMEVKQALSGNRRRVLVAHENSSIEITGEKLQCLRPGAWLNDEVINLYLELLKERENREPKKFLKCHFFNTFFYKKLIGGNGGYDYKSVRRWTTQRKLGYSLTDCDKIFVPIHKEIHWCLAIINKKDEKFQYLDSLGGKDPQVLKALARYFVDEVKDKHGRDIDVRSWRQEYVEDLPEQENGYDCGMFMIKYADFYSRGLELCFNQEHMPYFRLRTAKEILRLRAD